MSFSICAAVGLVVENVHLNLVVSKLHEYYAEVSGLLAPDSFYNFIIGFCFSFSDRPTQNQKTHWTIIHFE